MTWDDDIAAARVEKREAEEEKQRAAKAARSAESEQLARLEPQLAALATVRAALGRSGWLGAYRSREGLFRVQCVAEMPVTEIVDEVGDHETGHRKITADIVYMKHPRDDGAVILVRVGISSVFSDRLIGDIQVIGDRWQELTPELIKRAAARYCVTHNVELSLE